MISQLAAPIRRLTTGVTISDLTREGEAWRLRSSAGTISARKVLLATGRYGPLLMRKALPSHALRFVRLELGVRIEQAASEFFLADHPQLDPKYVWAATRGSGATSEEFDKTRRPASQAAKAVLRVLELGGLKRKGA